MIDCRSTGFAARFSVGKQFDFAHMRPMQPSGALRASKYLARKLTAIYDRLIELNAGRNNMKQYVISDTSW